MKGHETKSSGRDLILVQPDRQSTELIDGLVSFAGGLCQAFSTAFFWIGADDQLIDIKAHNISQQLLAEYNDHMGQYDPLHISRLKQRGTRIATLHADHEGMSAVLPEYCEFLRSCGISDEIDLVFYRNNLPVASLVMTRSIRDSSFSLDALDWESLRRYIEVTLHSHWRIRSMNVMQLLVGNYDLKPRELEVVELLSLGNRNGQIANLMGISVETVKTHIVHILRKMHIDSRLELSAMLNSLQHSCQPQRS